MTTLFGWCMGPVGAAEDHEACPHQLGTDAGIATCPCACHNSEGGA